MSNFITVKYDSVENLTLEEDGNYHIRIPTFYEYNNYSNDKVDFIFDTGAYITVISRKEALIRGFTDQFTVKSNVPLSGFAGGCLADIKSIPGIMIGNRRLEGMKVAVPHIDTDINILGLNVIDLFKFYIDTEHDEVYLQENPKPSIPESLRCRSIHIIKS
ncbi:MAG: retroviral-like aspartic protease family protein [Oscillospiraceae bacterium]|nr:retroviral-like aspartic protease family protein [Oscillospiraceae bacterium]